MGKSLSMCKMIQVLLNLDTIKCKISAIASPGYFLPSPMNAVNFQEKKKLLLKWPYIYSVSVLDSTTLPSLILTYIIITL